MSKAAKGTLWVDTLTGDAYRLRDYMIDWKAKPFTGNPDQPAYSVMLAVGGNTTAYGDLPETCRMVWDPEGEPLGHKWVPNDAAMRQAGFEKRYLLVGHPAYPDPMTIWPATEERATEIWNSYCKDTFEEYVAAIGHTPRRSGGTPYTAETFNPRILITWEFKGDREIFVPGGEVR